MKTIEAYEQEIGYQVEEIPRIAGESRTSMLTAEEQQRSVITGTGDSLAAAMIAECASDNRMRCVDPLDILINPAIVADKVLYAVSISGSTATNIKAVRAARQRAAKSVAITAKRESGLAKVCDEVIELRFKNSGMLTAGSIGFTASMLASLSLVRDVKKITDVRKLFESASRDAGGVTLGGNEVHMLGSWITYPLAIYGSAKVTEVLGIKARPARLEQFSHMEIFSLRKDDLVLILSGDAKAEELSSKLREDGYDAMVFKPKGRNLEEQSIYYSFLLQMIPLHNAKRLKQDECYFITNDRLRGISSSMIY